MWSFAFLPFIIIINLRVLQKTKTIRHQVVPKSELIGFGFSCLFIDTAGKKKQLNHRLKLVCFLHISVNFFVFMHYSIILHHAHDLLCYSFQSWMALWLFFINFFTEILVDPFHLSRCHTATSYQSSTKFYNSSKLDVGENMLIILESADCDILPCCWK